MLNFASVRNLCGITLAALVLAAPHVARAQYTYTITDLGTLGGINSNGQAINASGQVAGFSSPAGNGSQHAFRYSGATITDLGTLGGTYSYAYGINASGQVTGHSYTIGPAAQHAFRYDSTGMHDIGTLGGSNSYGRGINDSGQVAGYAYITGNNYVRAFRTSGTGMQDLGTLGGQNSYGFGINASGQVTGFAYLRGDGVKHAFRYGSTGMQDLGTLGGLNSTGLAINASGQVTGVANLTGDHAQHAFRFSGTTMTDLGTLGGNGSEGDGIDSFGTVVGFASLASGGAHAYYTVGNTMHDLNELLPANSGWELFQANAITDNFQITGYGTFKDQGTHAYILSRNAATVSGSLALEGVTSLNAVSSAAPLGTFHIGFRNPGATTEVYSADVALTTAQNVVGGTYTIANVPLGVYDIAIKGSKNLRVVLPSVTVSANTTLPGVTLPAGDANNDNSVDSTDFGSLIGAFNTDGAVAGSGYDPAADLNFDGSVDSTDFGLLIGEFNTAGAP